jgi:signal peptidase I
MQKAITYLTIAIVLAVVLKFWVIEGFIIPTRSMQPTLNVGDKLWINKIPFPSIKKGDIIAFDFPLDIREKYVKRCAAMSGDTLYKINNEYVLSPSNALFPSNSTLFIVPKRGQTLELNDANFSFYQPIIQRYEKTQAGIIGDKMYINNQIGHNYTFKQDYYYVLGDNLSDSYDSRNWGLVPASYVIGKALFVTK